MIDAASATFPATRPVGIGEMIVSADPNDILVAPSLGSCLAVAVYDGHARIGGLIHCLLPLSRSDEQRARLKPSTFVDTGVPKLLADVLQRGGKKERLSIYAGGAAQINDANNYFEIGKKNYTIFRKIMWKNDLLIAKEHVGGDCSRTMSLHIATGKVLVKTNGAVFELN